MSQQNQFVISQNEKRILDAAILQKAIDDEKVRLRKLNKLRREELLRNPPPLPKGQYRTIVIDPPWQISMPNLDNRPHPKSNVIGYPDMTVEEIARLNLPLADDSFVFLWTNHKHLPNALRILKCWGVKYRFTMVWHKPGGYQPVGTAQFNCEFIVVGAKGAPQFADLKNFNTAFRAPRSGHSVKPDEFYNTIRRVTLPPRLDMFGRRKIDGFESWGSESKVN